MQNLRIVRALVWIIVVLGAVAAGSGIWLRSDFGPYEIESVRGELVSLYGKGLYRHMSAEVAPQGIAQDYVTLFLALPALLIALPWAARSDLRGQFVLAGILQYLFVTYLFYSMMAMYNAMFLVYVALLGTTFFALVVTLLAFDLETVPGRFARVKPRKSVGGFLIFTSVAIAVLWLGIVVPPLLRGTVVPREVEHYTTLVVQGLDLGLLLPLGFVSGLLILRGRPLGFVLAPMYVVFLAFLMTALTAKVIAMGMLGYSIVPVVFIIPTFNVAAIALSVWVLRTVTEQRGVAT